MSNTETLDPWYYQVEVYGKLIRPGKGSKQTAKELIDRQNYRRKMLVDPVVKQYHFEGKTILDLACNCAYWSNEYIKAGAARMFGIEARNKYAYQARMYLDSERQKDGRSAQHSILVADLNKCDVYVCAVDFVLCAGILYHVKDYRRLLHWACQHSSDAVLIDTRVSADENKIEEPGGWHFDGVGKNVVKVNPSLDGMHEVLTMEGFSSIIQIPSAGPVPEEMKSNDNYDSEGRVTILATRNVAS